MACAFHGPLSAAPAPGVLRYGMDGYSVNSVRPLLDNEQTLITEESFETTANGSLVLRFKRPLSAGRSARPWGYHHVCLMGDGSSTQKATAGSGMYDEERGITAAAAVTTVAAWASERVCSAPKASARGLVGEEEGKEEEGGIKWFDPRDEGVVVLWAFALKAVWPSYHEATGAFLLPHNI